MVNKKQAKELRQRKQIRVLPRIKLKFEAKSKEVHGT
jgi:hypothetical protein